MNIVEVKNLVKSIGKRKIINDVSFTIEEGEILGLVGRSGEGKSVLLKTLMGFFKPDSGKILFKGDCSLGYSMQENALYENMTVFQNLDYFASINAIRAKKERISLLLKKLSLEQYKKVLVKNLSGGTKKRVDLACSMLTNPKILLLDEPLLGLDPGLVGDLADFIVEANKEGTTIVISSHQITELSQMCKRIILLQEGKLYSIKKEELKNVYKNGK